MNFSIFSSISLFLLIFIITVSFGFHVYGEEIITIIPGSSDENRYRFFDITSYPIESQKEIVFYNADNIPHQFTIKNDQDFYKETDIIERDEKYSFQLNNEGIYHFQSDDYPWMNGKIIVNDTIFKKTLKFDSMNVNIAFTNENVNNIYNKHFKIIFTDKKNKNNLEHVDYTFTIKDSKLKKIHQHKITHSGWGVEGITVKLDPKENYKGYITVSGLLFQPIEIETAKFDLS
ncbi:MAG: cupredoxin domain-containing protein [Nitrososphaeraceae archaeon]